MPQGNQKTTKGKFDNGFVKQQQKLKKTTIYLAVNALVAALYVALTLPFGALASNPYIQIRPGEALTVLPCVMPYVIPGLAVGCMISNIPSAFGILDVLLGTTITVIAGFITSKLKNKWLAPLPPIILNALFLPAVWLLSSLTTGNVTTTLTVYLLQTAGLLVSQSVVCYGLGIPLIILTEKKILPLLEK